MKRGVSEIISGRWVSAGVQHQLDQSFIGIASDQQQSVHAEYVSTIHVNARL